MAANHEAVIEELKAAGIQLYVSERAGRLRAYPPDLVTREQKQVIKAHKAELVRHLIETQGFGRPGVWK